MLTSDLQEKRFHHWKAKHKTKQQPLIEINGKDVYSYLGDQISGPGFLHAINDRSGDLQLLYNQTFLWRTTVN